MNIVVCGSKISGFSGNGKISNFSKFNELFLKQCHNRNLKVIYLSDLSHFNFKLLDLNEYFIFLLIYNEEQFDSYPSDSLINKIEVYKNAMIINHPNSARIISSKIKTNNYLSEFIKMPKIYDKNKVDSSGLVFINHDIGSHKQTAVRVLGEKTSGLIIAENQYVSEFIDTQIDYNNQKFFVAYRGWCFGSNCLSIHVRARSTHDKNPNVHMSDTPLIPGLLNGLYKYFFDNHMTEARNIASILRNKLGHGFYVFDILPCFKSNQIYVCEVGYKITDEILTTHLFPIRKELDFMTDFFQGKYITNWVNAMVNEAKLFCN